MYSDKSDKENDQEHDESDNEVLGKSEESDTDTSERQDDSYKLLFLLTNFVCTV